MVGVIGIQSSGIPEIQSSGMRGCRKIMAARVVNGRCSASASRPAIGRSLPRAATRRLVVGRGSYVDDLTAPGMLQAAFLRSPHPNAAIVKIDVQAARAAPGVVA